MLDGVLLVQKLLKLFTLDELLVANEHNELAAILQGKLGNAVLTDAEIIAESEENAASRPKQKKKIGGKNSSIYAYTPKAEL